MTFRILTLSALTAFGIACSIDAGGDSRRGSALPPTEEIPTSTAAVTPVRAIVDADQDMSNISGGQGVGVFVEYDRGGYWRVRWTCDSVNSRRTCNYQIGLSARAVSEVQNEGTLAPVVTASRIDVSTRTGHEVHGVNFRTPAGDVLTVDVIVDGLKTGAYVFFVQDGKVNGGYEGRLTNPLELVGSEG